MPSYSLNQIAEIISAKEVVNPKAEECLISGINSIEQADKGEISFIVNQKYARQLSSTSASAVIVPPDLAVSSTMPLLISSNPYLAYAKLSQLFEKRPAPCSGIHPTAVIGEGAQIDDTASIGANVVVGENARVGANSIVEAGCFIGDKAIIGDKCLLRANVTIHYACVLGNQVSIQSGSVIGADGFGYAPKSGGWEKIAQIGRVIIGDRVEIGANSCVDRGALQDTIIGDDVIIDNLVQVGHNVEIKSATAITSCVAIAGSAEIGKNCTIGGNSAINGHIQITDNVHIAGMSLVTKSINEPGQYASGMPLMDQKTWRRTAVHVRNIEVMASRVKKLEKDSKD